MASTALLRQSAARTRITNDHSQWSFRSGGATNLYLFELAFLVGVRSNITQSDIAWGQPGITYRGCTDPPAELVAAPAGSNSETDPLFSRGGFAMSRFPS